jgi:hypothetical protein
VFVCRNGRAWSESDGRKGALHHRPPNGTSNMWGDGLTYYVSTV